MNLITLQTLKNGTVARQLLSYGDNDSALSNLYQSMRASIADTNVVKVTCELIDDDGRISKCERYERTVQPTPEPTETEE